MRRSLEIAIRALVVVLGACVLFVELVGDKGPVAGLWLAGPDSAAIPLRLLLGVQMVWLWIRIDAVVGYLGRVGTEQERVQDRRCTAAALLVLVSIGFLLRIPDLGGPGLSWDEAMFAWVGSSQTLSDLWHSVSTRSPHPPGYFVLLHAILEWSWDPFWLRLPSVLAGSALIWASYAFVRRLAGSPAGLLMAALVTFAPTLVELSRVARNYSIGFLLGVGAAAIFVRYLHRERRRDAIAFALTSVAALLVHYCFLMVLAAQYVQLALVGIVGRRRPTWWVQVAACQIPVLVVIGILYQFHIRQLDPVVTANHEALYRKYLTLSRTELLAPIMGVWKYLVPLDLAAICLALYFAGLALLLARGMYVQLLVCVLPVASAYAGSWTGRYPLYESRHGAYLFPFLFAPVAVIAAEFASGGPGIRGCLHRLRPRATAASAGLSLWLGRVGVVGVGLALACFVDATMVEYRATATFSGAGMERVPEFLKGYRRDDIDRAFAIVEARAKPDDVVLLTRQALYEFRYHYGLRPVPQWQAGTDPKANLLAGPVPEKIASFDVASVRYSYSPHAGELFKWMNASMFLDAYEEIRDAYRLPGTGSLWVLRGGWDPSLSGLFQREHPGIPIDVQVTKETHDVLFRIDGEILAPTLTYRRMLLMREKAKNSEASPAPGS